MKRILHVVGGMNQAGTENFIMNLYRNIDKSKVQFDFLVNRPGFFDEEIRNLGGRIYMIPALQKVGYFRYIKCLDNFFNDHRNEYQIIHSHINKVSGLILERAKKHGIPIRIAHSHGSSYVCNIFARTYKELLGKKILKNATHYFACSEDAAKFLFANEYKNAYMIKNGIDTKKFIYSPEKRKEIRKKYNISDDSVVVGCVGRFNSTKNHLYLIDIFNEYNKINKNSYLMLVGEGELEEKIKEKVSSYNLNDKVIFAGITRETEKYYSSFDVFVLPSISEGLGIVLIEAQISGLNCLTSKGCVPIEAKITDRLEYISLDDKPKEWAKKIIKSNDRDNVNIEDNYDMKEEAHNLQEFYLTEKDTSLKKIGDNYKHN